MTPAGHAVSRHVQSGGCWAASQAGRDPRSAPRLARNRLGTGWPGLLGVRCRARADGLEGLDGSEDSDYADYHPTSCAGRTGGELATSAGLDRDGQPAQRRAAALHRSPDSDGVHRLCAAGLRGATLRAGKSDAGAPSPAGPPPVRYGKRWRPTDKSQGRLEPATRPADRFFSRRRLPAFTGEACG